MRLIRSIFAVGALLALASCQPAIAADCPVTMSAVVATLEGPPRDDFAVYSSADPDNLAKFKALIAEKHGDTSRVTGGILLKRGDAVFYGVETDDGCFSPSPILLRMLPKVSA